LIYLFNLDLYFPATLFVPEYKPEDERPHKIPNAITIFNGYAVIINKERPTPTTNETSGANLDDIPVILATWVNPTANPVIVATSKIIFSIAFIYSGINIPLLNYIMNYDQIP
jgi:hypothetical protein